MKARIIGLMLVAGILISGTPASAQFKDLLNKGANSLLDKKLKKDEEERKKKEAEKKKQQQAQSGDQTQQSNSNPAGSFMQKKMMGMMGMKDVKHETNYAFTSSMSMEMQSTDSLGKKSEKVLYTNYFDKNSKSFAMEFESIEKESKQKQKSLMIFDYKNWAMLILGGKEGSDKSGIAMEMAKDTAKQKQATETQQANKDLSNYNTYYKPTGRTKTIAGHSCKEYLHETPEAKSEIWTTNDVAFDYSSAYGHMGGMQTLATGGSTYGMGMIMEMHTFDKHSKAQSDLTVVDIKPSNAKSFDLTGYQIIGMSAGPSQQAKGKTKK